MPTMTTASPTLSVEQRQHYSKNMLRWAVPKLVHANPAWVTKNDIPRGEGNIIQWRRPVRLAVATTPLTESVTPASNTMQIDQVTATALQYGDWLKLSDRVQVQSIDNILQVSSKQLGQQAGETIDVLARDVYNAGTSVLYAGAPSITSRGAVTTANIITDAEIKKIRRALARLNVPTFDGGGGDGPGDGYYVALVHPDVFLDLEGTDGFKNTGYYSDPNRIYNGKIIKLYGIMFVESTQAKVFSGAGSGGIDVYSTICFGQDGLGSTALSDLGLEFITKKSGDADTSNPLNLYMTNGWKATFAAVILNQDFVLRYESAATA